MSEHTAAPPPGDPGTSPVLTAVNYFAAAVLLVLTVLVLAGVI